MLVVTLVYLAIIVLVPLSGVFFKSATMTPARLWETITDPRVVASYRLTFGVSLAAASSCTDSEQAWP